MAKSNYPDKLDTSVEIPVIRDNITEIGSDVLNSLRSAIFNIEKTLGINPQGAIGNTVAARLSNAVDDNGNILKEALDRAGLLSGPITDSDVSKTAAINESKLRLEFPTTLLQDQISILDNRLALFIETLEELNRILSSHVHPNATNRHFAQAISVVAAEVDDSSSPTMALGDGSLQDILEEFYNSHIHYTGEAIGPASNSHNSYQIYYDNEQTIDLIPSSSVQGAIDDLANLEGVGLRSSILNLNSNGIIRTGEVHDAFEANSEPAILVEESEIAYVSPSGKSLISIAFTANPPPTAAIRPFDTLEILTSPQSSDNKEYLISSVTLTSGGDLSSVEVFGGPKHNLTVGTTAVIKKSRYSSYNENGLNCAVRPRSGFSNTPVIQVAMPNSATIISSGIRPSNVIVGSTDVLAIEVDEGDKIEVNIANSSLEVQTLDSVVGAINKHSVDNNLNIFAYKVRSLRCFELAISHNMPNNLSDIKNRTLKIVEASSGDSAEAIGMEYLKDRLIEGSSGNSVHINGRVIEAFGLIKKYNSDSISIGAGTVELNALAADFLTDDIRVGDLCLIEGSSDSDDGTYLVKDVEDNKVTLDYTGNVFDGELSDASAVFFIRSCVPISELEFLESWSSIIADGQILLDVFMDETTDLFYHRRIDVVGSVNISNFYASITDVSKGFIGDQQEYSLSISHSDGTARLNREPGGLPGAPTYVGATGDYKVYSPDGMEYLVLSVFVPNPSLSPFGVSDLSLTLYGYKDLPDSVLHLSRALYSPEIGRVVVHPSSGALSSGAINPIIDKRTTGTIDDTIIGETVLERYIQGPRNELRGCGIIRSIDVEEVIDSGDGLNCEITVNPGVAVVRGTRFEYLGSNSMRYNYSNGSTNNFYIALDGHGCLLVANEIDDGSGAMTSPFSAMDVSYIAYVEIDTLTVTDLRLFVDHLDYKLIADITVANDQRFGHFIDIKTAVDYARMFSKMFPNMGTPSVLIKEGRYYIKEQINVNFSVKISGEGPNTVLQRDESYPPGLPGPTVGVDSPIFVIGDHEYSGTDDIGCGVTLERFTYESDFSHFDSNLTDTAISIRVSVDSANPILRFDNINYIGSESASITSSSSTSTGYEMPFVLNSGSTGAASGNIIISNCLFVRAGFGRGPILIFEDSLLQNTIIKDNITMDSIYSSDGITPDYDMAYIWFSPTLVSYMETGNALYPLVGP